MKRIISFIIALVTVVSVMPLTLAEEDYGENLCLGKEIYADSIYENNGAFAASHANDGLLGTTTATGSDSSDIRSGFKSYVVVDLGAVYKLNRVIVRSRRDLDAYWARIGFAAYIATKEDFSDAVQLGVKDWSGEFGSDLNIRLSQPQAARYVIAAHANKTGGVVISEMEAYGVEEVAPGKSVYTDVQGKVKNAANFLNLLGIMEGIGTNEFGGVNLISRGEAAMYMCKLADIPVAEVSEDVFQDVSATHQYAPYIRAALDYGMISKAEYFRPDEYIKGYELIKMILCVNGYYQLLQKNGTTNPSDFIYVADLCGMLDGTKSDKMSYVSRSDAALMMYSALISNYYTYSNGKFEEGNEALLERLFGYTLKCGIVNANGVTALDKVNSVFFAERVTIDNVDYSIENGLGMDYLGERVYFLTNSDNEIKGLWVDDEKTNIMTIYEKDIEEADFNAITTLVDGKKKKYKIEKNPYKIFNGIADLSITEADLIPENGYLTLVDNDNDGYFEVVKICKPEVIYVDSADIDEEEKTVNISDVSGTVKNLKPDYAKVTDADGKELSLKKIKQGKLLYVFESRNGKLVNIEMQNPETEGIITAYNDDCVAIDGTEYEKTSYFKRNFASLELGKKVQYFLDKSGGLIYITVEGIGKTTEVLAVVRKAIINPDDEVNLFDVYDENKQFRKLELADKVVVNNSKKNLSQISALGRSYFEGKLVLLSIVNDSVVKSIITEDYADGDIYKSNIKLNGMDRGNAGFYSGMQLSLPISDKMPLFTIPIDKNTGVPCTGTYDTLYDVCDITSKYSIRASVPADSEVSVYGLNEFGEGAVAVSRVGYSSDSFSYGTISSQWSMGMMVFNSVTLNCNNNDECYYTIKGYDLVTGGAKTITTDINLNKVVNTFKIRHTDWFNTESIPPEFMPSSAWMYNTKLLNKQKINSYFIADIQTLEKGDIIAFNKGKTITELELVLKKDDFDESKCGVVYNSGDSPDTAYATTRLQYAIVDEIRDGHIRYLYQTGIYENVDLSKFEGNVIILENGRIGVYPISAAGIHISSGDKIVIYMDTSHHKSIVVYK